MIEKERVLRQSRGEREGVETKQRRKIETVVTESGERGRGWNGG